MIAALALLSVTVTAVLMAAMAVGARADDIQEDTSRAKPRD